MKLRFIALLIGLFFSAQSIAQNAAADAIRLEMVETANAFLESISGAPSLAESLLSIDDEEALSYDFNDPQRLVWQYWPAPRVGLSLEQMGSEQKNIAHDLLKTALSTTGYFRTLQVMQLEQVLDMLETGALPRSLDHYILTFFGTPTMSEPWGWRFEGHHVSINVTVTPDGVNLIPSFFGSNPAQILSGPMAGVRVHGNIEDTARQLVQSLDAGQKEITIIADQPPNEIFATHLRVATDQWEAWRDTLLPEGIYIGGLNEMQQTWAQRILDEVFGNFHAPLTSSYENSFDIADLRFLWMGSTERGEPHYFRIQGETFIYEFDNVQDDGNHVHSVWIDKESDFGADLLGEHYQVSHLGQ